MKEIAVNGEKEGIFSSAGNDRLSHLRLLWLKMGYGTRPCGPILSVGIECHVRIRLPATSDRQFGSPPKSHTAKDVVCTWDLLTGRSSEKLRINPRKAWYRNLEEVVPNGDNEVIFRLKRPQPSFIALLASGFTPVYPCHVSPRDMRSHPVGTGPFKFVEFRPNEIIRVARNPDYWKNGRPYLDGIEYTIIRNPSSRYTGLSRRQGRHDLPVLSAGAAPEGRQEAGPASDLRARAVERQPQRDDESRGGALR